MERIERPDWINGYNGHLDKSDVDWLNEWFNKKVEPINELLEGAIEVNARLSYHPYDPTGDKDKIWYCGTAASSCDTHKAYLIGIEPIKKETAYDILDDFVNKFNAIPKHREIISADLEAFLPDIILRARKLLEQD